MDDMIFNRSATGTLQHMQQSMESGEAVYGVMKQSALVQLTHFNIITGFVPCSMHCINLGIAKQFIKYWLDTSNNPYSLNNQDIALIDDILTRIKVPSKLTRYSRSIRERSCWKAREFENWVLYYSTIVLLQIPRFKNYVQHWSYLVKAYFILLQVNITQEQILEADHLLKTFVALAEYYYSKSAMTFNVHQLVHLSHSVINFGPLWSHSGYCFENGNGKIVERIKAAKGVVHQICRNIGISRSALILQKYLDDQDPDSMILEYVDYLENRESIKTNKTDTCRYFEKADHAPMNWRRELDLSDTALIYKKMVKNNCLYRASNDNQHRSNNSYALLTNNKFVKIHYFIVDRAKNIEYTICNCVNVTDIFQNHNLNNFHIKKCSLLDDTLHAVNTCDIDKICLLVQNEQEIYISPVPNLSSY
ncbi:hypothetical protein TKK_0010464 [Trichogramma kaykai]|uniref:Uncharacterized protein n=1 Tax=Trichogramma kaykai TaxID=54128 RepID=A0ABD2WXA5_9HYME